jgi:hypothetical protein
MQPIPIKSQAIPGCVQAVREMGGILPLLICIFPIPKIKEMSHRGSIESGPLKALAPIISTIHFSAVLTYTDQTPNPIRVYQIDRGFTYIFFTSFFH